MARNTVVFPAPLAPSRATILLSGTLHLFGYVEGGVPGWLIQIVQLAIGTTLGIRFLGFYTVELLLANLRVAVDVLTPRLRSNPGIIGIRLCELTDRQLIVLTNLVTMTPGTLSLDLSEDRRVLFVHVMFLDDPETFRENIKSGLERRILEVTR